MTINQAQQIAELTQELEIGSRADQGIKHVLGKMPVNMSESRAAKVIAQLQDELDEKEDAEGTYDKLDWRDM